MMSWVHLPDSRLMIRKEINEEKHMSTPLVRLLLLLQESSTGVLRLAIVL